MKKRILAALAALLMVTGISVAVAAPAQAHNRWECPHGQSCLFLNVDGGGWIFNIVWSANPKDTCVDLPSFYRNDASSVVADFGSGWDLLLYEDIQCGDYFPDRFTSPTSRNFVWCNTCNSYAHLNDDVESFKIVQ